MFDCCVYALQVNRCLLELAYQMAHEEERTVQSLHTTQSYSLQSESEPVRTPSASNTSGLKGLNHGEGKPTSSAHDRLGLIAKTRTGLDQEGCIQSKQKQAILASDEAMALDMYEQDLKDYEAAQQSLEQQQLNVTEHIQANLHAQQAELNNNAALQPGLGRFPARLQNAQLQQDYMMQDQVQTLKVQQQQQQQHLEQQQARLAALVRTQRQLQQRQDEARRAERYRERQQVQTRMQLQQATDGAMHNTVYTPSR